MSSELDLQSINRGRATLVLNGKSLFIEWSDDSRKMVVKKNGIRHSWTKHASHLYQPASEEIAPIASIWGEGGLRVESTHHIFECSVRTNGKVEFANADK